jgi:hypothetical protein
MADTTEAEGRGRKGGESMCRQVSQIACTEWSLHPLHYCKAHKSHKINLINGYILRTEYFFGKAHK